MGTSTSNTNSASQNQNFWAPQAPYITGVMSDAQNDYQQSQAGNAATQPSNFVAGLTPQQVSTFNNMAGYNSASPGALSSSGTSALNTGNGSLNAASAGYAGYNPASSNNSAAIAQGANSYVQGVNIPAQVQNAMQGATEEANDVTNPQTVNSATQSGNANSSRTGLAEGLVDRSLAEQAGNLTGTLESQAYNTGAGLTESALASNNQDTLSALSGQGALGLGALNSGTNSLNSGANIQNDVFNTQMSGGSGLQGGNQSTLTNQLDQNQYATQNPFSSLSQYAPYVTTPYGSSGTQQSTTQTTPSFLQTLGQVLGAGTSLGTGLFGGNGLFGNNGAFGSNGAFKLG